MAASIAIEEHSGTFSGHRREHNGYHAGSFSGVTLEGLSHQPAAQAHSQNSQLSRAGMQSGRSQR